MEAKDIPKGFYERARKSKEDGKLISNDGYPEKDILFYIATIGLVIGIPYISYLIYTNWAISKSFLILGGMLVGGYMFLKLLVSPIKSKWD